MLTLTKRRSTKNVREIRRKKPQFHSKLLQDHQYLIPCYIVKGLAQDKKDDLDSNALAEYFALYPPQDRSIANALARYCWYALNPTFSDSGDIAEILYTGANHFTEYDLAVATALNKEDTFEVDACALGKYLLAGFSERNWYTDTLRAFQKVLPQHGYTDIELFVKLFAITSPRTHFESNITLALKAYDIYTNGGSFEQGFLPGVAANLVDFQVGDFVFENPETNGRRKITNFVNAILGDTKAVVVDTWLLGAYGMVQRYEHKGIIRAHRPERKEYSFIEGHIKLLAHVSGFEPRQIVSMIWSGSKIVESRHKKVNTENILTGMFA